MKTLSLALATLFLSSSVMAMDNKAQSENITVNNFNDTVCNKAVDLITEQALGDKQFQSMMNCRYSIANSEGYSLEAVMVISNMNKLIAYIVSVKDGVEVFDQREVDTIVAMANNSISDYQASKWPEKNAILKEAQLTINGIIELKTALVEVTKQLS